MKSRSRDKEARLTHALASFTNTIENTGGVKLNKEGNYEPIGDHSWFDFGDAYVRACHALGTPPMVVT